MATLRGPVTISALAVQSGSFINHDLVAPWMVTPSFSSSSSGRFNSLISRFWAIRRPHAIVKLAAGTLKPSRFSESRTIHCSSSMSSDDNGSATEGFSDNDEDYINSTVIEAVEVKSGLEGFLIKMRDGHYIRCVHNNPDSGHLPNYAPQPAIVLKMEDGSNLLLPIIVLELPCTMLMEAVRNVHVARPTVYNVLQNMMELMGFKVKLVRVTRRIHEAYYAQLYLSKQVGDEVQQVSLDLRPSDAINIAVRCQAPIQVNRQLAYGDGVRVVSDPAKLPSPVHRSRASVALTELDRSELDTCTAAEEFVLIRSMMMAAAEERYDDAARLRDELIEFRAKKVRSTKQM